MAGLDAHHTIFSTWFGRKMSNTFGLQVRNDWINNGLYVSENRVRMAKTDYYATGISFYPPTSTTLPTCIPTTTTITLPNGITTPTTTIVPNTCPTLPATTERDNFTDTIVGFYAENKIQWANKFRSVVGLRGDDRKVRRHQPGLLALGERGQFRHRPPSSCPAQKQV